MPRRANIFVKNPHPGRTRRIADKNSFWWILQVLGLSRFVAGPTGLEPATFPRAARDVLTRTRALRAHQRFQYAAPVLPFQLQLALYSRAPALVLFAVDQPPRPSRTRVTGSPFIVPQQTFLQVPCVPDVVAPRAFRLEHVDVKRHQQADW